MPKSKNRKNHKQKVAARNKRINDQKDKMQKMQKQFLMDLIKREQEKGAFDNTESFDKVESNDVGNSIIEPVDGPQVDIDTPQGPQI